MTREFCWIFFLATVHAQFLNGRRLEGPVAEYCHQRKIHDTFNNKGLFYSWRDPATANLEEDWLGARNFCRKRCMDSISLDSPELNNYIKNLLATDNVRYIWTSGRLCDFTGCEREDLQPRRVNGWFWTATRQKLAPATNRTANDWSETGGIQLAQPDNREGIQNGAPENCLGLLNNFYKDGINWHDVACHHKKPFICQDSDQLLQYIAYVSQS